MNSDDDTQDERIRRFSLIQDSIKATRFTKWKAMDDCDKEIARLLARLSQLNTEIQDHNHNHNPNQTIKREPH